MLLLHACLVLLGFRSDARPTNIWLLLSVPCWRSFRMKGRSSISRSRRAPSTNQRGVLQSVFVGLIFASTHLRSRSIHEG